MKLIDLRKVGRYRHRISEQTVTVHIGRKPGRTDDRYFYMRQGHKIVIPHQQFFDFWEPVPDDAQTPRSPRRQK